MHAMLTERYASWFNNLRPVVREDLVNAVTAMVSASRHEIADAAAEARKAEERRTLTEPCERPCFACGRPAMRVAGRFFDPKMVFTMWVSHHHLADLVEEGDSACADVNATLHDHANRGHARDGAHARCALVDAVRDAKIDDEYSAFDVPLPAEYA